MQCLITQFAGRAQAGHFFQRLVNFCREEIYFSHRAEQNIQLRSR